MTRTADIREAENRGLEKAAVYFEMRAKGYETGLGSTLSAWRGRVYRDHATEIRALKEET